MTSVLYRFKELNLLDLIPEFKAYPQAKYMWQCNLCSYHGSLSNKYGHLAVNHEVFPNKKLPCEVCGKVFWVECHLKNHMRIHTGEKPFKW